MLARYRDVKYRRLARAHRSHLCSCLRRAGNFVSPIRAWWCDDPGELPESKQRSVWIPAHKYLRRSGYVCRKKTYATAKHIPSLLVLFFCETPLRVFRLFFCVRQAPTRVHICFFCAFGPGADHGAAESRRRSGKFAKPSSFPAALPTNWFAAIFSQSRRLT